MNDKKIEARIKEIKAALKLAVEAAGANWKDDGWRSCRVNGVPCVLVDQALDRSSGAWHRRYGEPNVTVGRFNSIRHTRVFRHPKTGRDFDYQKIARAAIEYAAADAAYHKRQAENNNTAREFDALAKRINAELPCALLEVVGSRLGLSLVVRRGTITQAFARRVLGAVAALERTGGEGK